MDPKSNPFLMDDYPAEADAAMTQASNPFLQDFGDPATDVPPGGAEANPFLSFVPDPSYQPPSDATNPFASFGVEAAAIPEPATDVFVNPEAATVPAPEPEPLISIDPIAEAPVSDQHTPSPPQMPPEQSTPSKPARPPPPPRPGPPPPPTRNPKDMILSVTGAMDETSSQMLDKLQATRTPSPTLMQSPSPTPEQSLAEMVEVEASIPDLAHDASEVTIEGATTDEAMVATTRRDSSARRDSSHQQVQAPVESIVQEENYAVSTREYYLLCNQCILISISSIHDFNF